MLLHFGTGSILFKNLLLSFLFTAEYTERISFIFLIEQLLNEVINKIIICFSVVCFVVSKFYEQVRIRNLLITGKGGIIKQPQKQF